MKNFLTQFWNDEGGQDVVEYALMLVLIAGVAILVLTQMGINITQIFSKVTNKLQSANEAIS